jgi:hypothetical protein
MALVSPGLEITVTDEMRAIGITDNEIEVPLNFDPSNFFG